MRKLNLAVLDFGETEMGLRAAKELRTALAADSNLAMMDHSLVRAAARGVGYEGSLNMTRQEAHDLAAAIGCDVFITGDAQTLRRSPSTGADYFEAYASIFIVDAASGKLLMWDRVHNEAATAPVAEKQLLADLSSKTAVYSRALRNGHDEEMKKHAQAATAAQAIIYEEAPAEDSPDAKNFRAPQPYRRLRPAYPSTAAQAEAEATVDASVDVDANGEVANVEIVRWAGFGLDEATRDTIRLLHFRPAMRDGVPVPTRILLRYNFRKPPKSKQQA